MIVEYNNIKSDERKIVFTYHRFVRNMHMIHCLILLIWNYSLFGRDLRCRKLIWNGYLHFFLCLGIILFWICEQIQLMLSNLDRVLYCWIMVLQLWPDIQKRNRLSCKFLLIVISSKRFFETDFLILLIRKLIFKHITQYFIRDLLYHWEIQIFL